MCVAVVVCVVWVCVIRAKGLSVSPQRGWLSIASLPTSPQLYIPPKKFMARIVNLVHSRYSGVDWTNHVTASTYLKRDGGRGL